jgi:uncharacterized LabA/DUF88 family protein
MKRIWLFIDYANLLNAYRKLDNKVDFKKLVVFIEEKFQWKLEAKNIYFAYPEKWTRNYNVNWIHNFWTFLKKNLWFNIVKKSLKRIELKDFDWNLLLWWDWKPILKEKWNLDIELTMDIMLTWKNFDIIILISWDSDFYPLIKFLLLHWKKVYVFSTKWNISGGLRANSTGYFDICKIKKLWDEK